MWSFFREPVDNVLRCLDPIMRVRSPWRAMGPMVIAMAVTWFVYVPIHELLHVYGCIWTGGEVTRLELAAHYGANLLKPYFPFIESGSDYAGQLTGFDTKGSDAIYLATVFGPFLLSVLIGVPLIKFCMKGRRPLLFGVGIVVGLAPFYNIPGDYYEMGSIMVTRAVTWISGGGNPPAFEGIRSDDIYKLIGDLVTQPSELGLSGAGRIAAGTLLILLALAVDVLLAFLTYFLGARFGRALVGPPPPLRPRRATARAAS